MSQLYIKETSKSVEEAVSDVEEAVKNQGFGVLHVYDFKATMQSKGFDLPSECRVLEICNPKQASEVLKTDMNVNMALPCRISVYEDGGKTKIGMIRPTALLKLVSDSKELVAAAEEVEKVLIKAIEVSV